MKYRCKQSGNYIVLTDPVDIESMKKDENYEVVDEDASQEKQKREVLKLGRKKHGDA